MVRWLRFLALPLLAALAPVRAEPQGLRERHLGFLGGKAVTELRSLAMTVSFDGRAEVEFLLRRRPYAFRESWRFPDGRTRTWVTDGRYAWHQPEKGEARLLAAAQARSLLAHTVVEGLRYLELSALRILRPVPLPRFPGAPRPDPVPEVTPVEFMTPAGTTCVAFFEKETGRLHAVQSGLAWIYLDEWKSWDGLRLPAVRYAGFPTWKRPRVLRVKKVEVNPDLPPAAFGSGAPVKALPEDVAASPLVVAPFAVPHSAMLVVPSLALDRRRKVPALVDTGGSTCLVYSPVLRALRIPVLSTIEFMGTAGPMKSRIRWLDEVALPAWSFSQVVVMDSEGPTIERFGEGLRPQALLCGRLLFDGAPVLDLETGRLRFRGRPVKPLSGKNVVRLPLHRTGNGRYRVDIKLGKRSLRVLLDTGSAAPLTLMPDGLRKAGLSTDPAWWRERGAVRMPFTGAGGQTRHDLVARLEELALGPVCFESFWGHISGIEEPQHLESEGLLGAGALLPFARVGIDTERNLLELDPGPDTSRRRIPAAGPLLGLSLRASPEGARVRKVLAGLPAARAGLRPGDLLIAIDGDSVRRRPAHEVTRRLWLEPDQRVKLTLLREGEKEPLEVELP